MTTMDLTTQPPYSVEAEQAVLGSMITTPPVIAEISNVLVSDDLYEPRHATIMDTLLWLADEGKPVEIASLIAQLQHVGELEKVGGREYIAHLYRSASAHNAMYYADIVSQKSAKRQIMALHMKGMRDAQDGNGFDLKELVSSTQVALDDISEKRVSNEVVRAGHHLDATFDKIEELGKAKGGVTGVPTGFYELDRLTYGLHPGQMVVIAARPGVGKSTLGLDIMRAAAIKHKIPSLLFTLEMSVEEVNMRLLSAECGVELNHIRSGGVTAREWAKMAAKQNEIAEAPLFLDDTANNTMSQIRQKARRVQQRHGLGLIVIDYLQLMTGDRRTDSRQQEVSEISRSIKLLAKELGVPILAMSQLNRGSESRTDNRPKVSDLRESGSIEQDADAVWLIHREEMYDPDTLRAGEADIILGKQRSAPQGVAVLGWQGGFSRFSDLARTSEPT